MIQTNEILARNSNGRVQSAILVFKFINYNLISLKYSIFSHIHVIYRESLTLNGHLGQLQGFDLYQTKINTDRIQLKSADIEPKDYLVYVHVVRRLFSQESCVRLQSSEDNAERPDNSSDLQKLESLCEDLHSCVQKLVRPLQVKLII